MTPLVSIISPTYNHADYLAQCIDSVLRQSFTEWEMIIINDGSTDQTVEIANSYVNIDSRIKLINQSNVGVFKLGQTYNRGLHESTGKYIAILEGDDVWEPDKLKRQVDQLENDDSIVLAWGKAQLVNSDFSVVYEESPEWKFNPDLYNNQPRGSIIELYRLGQFIPAVTIIIRRSILEEIGGFIQAFNMPLVDFTTILELSLYNRFYFDNHVLGKWRIYSTQTTKKYPVEIYTGIKSFLQDFLPRVPEMNKAKQNIILKHYEMLCLIAFARSGRYKLIRKEYKSARRDYIKALTYPASGKWIWRLRAAIGYSMSLLHLDVEWMAKLLGRKTYKK